MNTRLLFVTCLSVMLLGNSCNLLDPDEPLPMYLKIEQPKVLLDPNNNLTSTVGIKDLWIDQGPNFLGIHEAGKIVPVFENEFNNYAFTGGIFNSGLAGFRNRYPFWRIIEQTIEHRPLDTVVLSPVFEYFPRDTALTYVFEENFETGGRSLVDLGVVGPTVRFERSANSAFEGSQAGRALFSLRDSVMAIVSDASFTLPTSRQNTIWLEVTFKSDVPFAAGLYYEEVGQPNFGPIGGDILFQSDTWTTVYIPLGDPVRSLGGSNLQYRVFFQANGQGDSGELYLDYIRLIHFAE